MSSSIARVGATRNGPRLRSGTIYVGSNLDAESVAGLINLFSRDVFRQNHGGEDLLGRILRARLESVMTLCVVQRRNGEPLWLALWLKHALKARHGQRVLAKCLPFRLTMPHRIFLSAFNA